MKAPISTIKDADQFARDNYNLIYHFAKSYLKDKRYNNDDVISAAQLGFVMAMNGFDPDKGFQFATYAAMVVGNELNMFVRNYKKTMRFGLMYSLDYEVPPVKGEGEGTALIEIIAAPEDKSFDNSVTLELVDKELSKISERDRRVFLKFLDNKNQKDIAKEEGLSQSYVSRIITKVQKTLQKKVGY